MPALGNNVVTALLKRFGFERDWYLILLGAAIGTAAALGTIAFSWALHGLEHVLSERRDGLPIWTLPLIPMAGALVTGLLVTIFAADARGHGVPQVIAAVLRRNGDIPMRVGVVKALASIATVGTGGSSGTEGPIVQIGATFGSVFGRHLRVVREYRPTLVGCGAAAGIASIFNAPIAGVFFVLEILLRDFSLRTFTPVVIASVFSAATTQALVNEQNEAIFVVAGELTHYRFTFRELPSYAVLGLVCGLVAVLYNRVLHGGEELYAKVKLHPVVKPVTGALLLGLLGMGYFYAQAAATPEAPPAAAALAAPEIGEPPAGDALPGALDPGGPDAVLPREDGRPGPRRTPAFFGNGYDTIRFLLNPAAYGEAFGGMRGAMPPVLWLLLLLAACKILATTFTLASGGSGGTFAPALFIGAAAGAAFGVLLDGFGLIPDGGSPAAYALVGMAAVLAGSTHAPLTAILILFELTRDEYVLLPIMLAAVLATAASQVIDRDSIYTAGLRRAGLLFGTARDFTLLRRIACSQVRLTPLPEDPVYASDPLSKLITLHATHNVPDFPVVDPNGRYLGMVTGADMRTALIDREAIPLLLVAELMRADLPTVTAEESLDSVMDKFSRNDVASLCMVDQAERATPLGLVTRANVMRRYQEALEEQG